MANIFISHRGIDSVLAERLANNLRNAGHDVWLDVWKIEVGTSIVDRINSGLRDASHLILCYSSEGVEAPWISREWQSTLARLLNGHAVKILPVLLTGHQAPAMLADIAYIDLRENWDGGIRRLLGALIRN
jgi:hypothetical protein